jgi:hypothetical protein
MIDLFKDCANFFIQSRELLTFRAAPMIWWLQCAARPRQG